MRLSTNFVEPIERATMTVFFDCPAIPESLKMVQVVQKPELSNEAIMSLLWKTVGRGLFSDWSQVLCFFHKQLSQIFYHLEHKESIRHIQNIVPHILFT